MTAIRIRRFESDLDLIDAAANLLEEQLARAFGQPHAVMLSGGNTPAPIYAEVAQRRTVAADDAYVLFSDERMVPWDSPLSNYRTAAGMLRAMMIADDHTLAVHPELRLKQAAARYDRDLRQFLRSGGRITLGFLGLGADGHTASIFSPADVPRADDALAAAVKRKPRPNRVTVTAELIGKIEVVIFLVVGPEKAEAVNRLLTTPDQVTAGLAVRGASNIQLWTV